MLHHPVEKKLHMKPVVYLILLIIFVTNLRAPITSVGVLVGDIQASFDMSNILVGALTTLPLIAFALFSPIVPQIAKQVGIEKTLFFSLILLLLGHLIRPYNGVVLLFIGTALIGLAISIGNVLAPAFVKKTFPHHVGLVTGFYTVSMNLTGALAAGLSIPFALHFGNGWRSALGVWGLLTIFAIICWLPLLRKRPPTAENSIADKRQTYRTLLRSKTAWHVTIFMGLQSMLFYCFVAWLPIILQGQGLEAGTSGWMLSMVQFAQLPIVFVVPMIADKMKRQTVLIWVTFIMIFLGIIGVFYAEGYVLLGSVILFGMGAGVAFALAMMFFILRTKDAVQAATLSGMAQSIGYLLAALGPLLLGFIYDLTANWYMSMVFLLLASCFLLLVGLGAAKERYV